MQFSKMGMCQVKLLKKTNPLIDRTFPFTLQNVNLKTTQGRRMVQKKWGGRHVSVALNSDVKGPN